MLKTSHHTKRRNLVTLKSAGRISEGMFPRTYGYAKTANSVHETVFIRGMYSGTWGMFPRTYGVCTQEHGVFSQGQHIGHKKDIIYIGHKKDKKESDEDSFTHARARVLSVSLELIV